MPDGHDDAASEEADNDLCNLVAAAISVGYWAPLVKVSHYLLAFCNLICIQVGSTTVCFTRWDVKGYDDLKNSDEDSDGDWRCMVDDVDMPCKAPAKRKLTPNI